MKRHLEQFRQLGIIQLSEEQLDEILCAVDSRLSAEPFALNEDLCRSGCHGTPARMPYPLLLETFGKTDASVELLNRTFGLIQAGSSLLLVIPSAVLIGSSLVMPLAGATGGGLFYLTLDNWNAGVQAVFSGEPVETWTQQGATHLAQMGLEPEVAQWVGVGVDLGVNFLIGGGAVYQAKKVTTVCAINKVILETRVDPAILRLLPTRDNADPFKLNDQMRSYGSSMENMPPIQVTVGANREMMINDGVTRATRIAIYNKINSTSNSVLIEVIENNPNLDLSTLQKIGNNLHGQ